MTDAYHQPHGRMPPSEGRYAVAERAALVRRAETAESVLCQVLAVANAEAADHRAVMSWLDRTGIGMPHDVYAAFGRIRGRLAAPHA